MERVTTHPGEVLRPGEVLGPGEVLRPEFLAPLGISANALALRPRAGGVRLAA